jgi:DNA-binding GntR family transcriptional regulator
VPVVRRHSAQIDRLRRLHLPVEGKSNQIVEDHITIVEAMARGEPGTAQQCLRDHLSKSLAFSAEMRIGFPDYFRDEVR